MPPLPEGMIPDEQMRRFALEDRVVAVFEKKFLQENGRKPKIVEYRDFKSNKLASMSDAEAEAFIQSQDTAGANVESTDTAEKNEKLSAKEDLKRELAQCREKIAAANLPEYMAKFLRLTVKNLEQREPVKFAELAQKAQVYFALWDNLQTLATGDETALQVAAAAAVEAFQDFGVACEQAVAQIENESQTELPRQRLEQLVDQVQRGLNGPVRAQTFLDRAQTLVDELKNSGYREEARRVAQTVQDWLDGRQYQALPDGEVVFDTAAGDAWRSLSRRLVNMNLSSPGADMKQILVDEWQRAKIDLLVPTQERVAKLTAGLRAQERYREVAAQMRENKAAAA